MSNPWVLLGVQIIALLIILFVILAVIRYARYSHIIKRIDRYSINSITREPITLFDSFYDLYNKLVSTLTKFLTKTSKKSNIEYNRRLASKILLAISLAFIYFAISLIFFTIPNVYEIAVILLFGFFIPDLLILAQKYRRGKLIERDLLNAIMIMNNAFKAGRSTIQALEMVKEELEGPISDEFAKMLKEIAYGLSLEMVFQRFSERVDVEEAKYITSSLIVLNKTGGNIVKVFSSIESSLYSKKKWQLKWQSSIASSTLMIRFLLFLPFLFIGLILWLNPLYFNALFASTLGWLFISAIIIFYFIYVIVVRRIIKIRM